MSYFKFDVLYFENDLFVTNICVLFQFVYVLWFKNDLFCNKQISMSPFKFDLLCFENDLFCNKYIQIPTSYFFKRF